MKKKGNKYAVTKPYFGIPTAEEAATKTETKRMLLKFDKAAADFHSLLMNGCRIENSYITFSKDLLATNDDFFNEKEILATMINTGINKLNSSKDIIIEASKIIESSKSLTKPEDAITACFALSSVSAQLNELLQEEISGNYAEVLIKVSEYFNLFKDKLGELKHE